MCVCVCVCTRAVTCAVEFFNLLVFFFLGFLGFAQGVIVVGVEPRRPNVTAWSTESVRAARSPSGGVTQPPLGFRLPCQNRGLSTPCVDEPIADLALASVIGQVRENKSN